jgi:RNA polymerase sigma factor (sigma-70 family)
MHRLIEHLRRAAQGDERGPTDGELLERFVAVRDEAAFEALVRRHGPLVLGVCRRVLGNADDAEDAFQAAWLVLVRKAAGLRRHGPLAGWLHAVAYRAAREARRAAARRRDRERQAARSEAVGAGSGTELREVLDAELSRLLDAELSRLPEAYRTAVLLCELEGLGYREAARRLGWREGTLAGRLSRARRLLARRLARRGLAPAGGAGAALLPAVARAEVPAGLAASISRAAVLSAAGPTAGAGAVSETIRLLTQGVLRTMWITKVKLGAALLVAVAAAGVGVGLLAGPGSPDRAEAAQASAPGGGKAPPAARPKAGDRGTGKTGAPARPGLVKPAAGRVGPRGQPGAGLQALAKVDFNQTPLSEVLQHFRDTTGMNMVVEPDAARVDMPVNLRLHDVPLRTALRFALRGTDLDYYVEDGVLVITLAQTANERKVRCVYPVGDLVLPLTPDEKRLADNLIQVITGTVEPKSWAVQGGEGAIDYLAASQSLVVTHVAAVQRQIEELLEELRAARAKHKAPERPAS